MADTDHDPIILGPPGAPFDPQDSTITPVPKIVKSLRRRRLVGPAARAELQPSEWPSVDLRSGKPGYKLEPFTIQGRDQPGCAAFAVAVAIRASLSNRGVDPGPLNPYFL